MKILGYVEFHCIINEGGTRCNRHHLEPYVTMDEKASLVDCGYICDEHQKIYSWLSRLTGIVDESAQLASQIIQDPLGARTNDFRTGGTKQVDGGKERIVGASVGSTQRKAGMSGTSAIKGWSKVGYYPEYNDCLMIRNEEAKDPQAEYAERKLKKIFGLAITPPKEEDPFGGRLDEKT